MDLTDSKKQLKCGFLGYYIAVMDMVNTEHTIGKVYMQKYKKHFIIVTVRMHRLNSWYYIVTSMVRYSYSYSLASTSTQSITMYRYVIFFNMNKMC